MISPGESTAEIAVVGLGYLGLPLAVAFASANFRVTGIDQELPVTECKAFSPRARS